MAAVSSGGSLQFSIDGTPYSVRGMFKIQPASKENTAGRNLDGTAFFTTKPIESTMEFDLSDAGNLPVKAFQSMTNETLYAVLSNGKVYVMTGAVFVGTPDVDVVEGKISGKFSGDVEEVVAA